MTRTDRRVAIVTGAARGVGQATAVRLGRDGFDVGLVDLDQGACQETVKLLDEQGAHALSVSADVANTAQVVDAVAAVQSKLGPPVVLVNNAGITRDNLLFRLSDDDWDSVIQVHLRGAFLMSRAVQSAMVEARWGRIINISSVAALGNRGQSNYAAAKAGLQGLARTLAIELGPFGVTANAIAPGFIETAMTAATANRVGAEYEEFKKAAAGRAAVGRVGQPEDVAAAVSYFASDEASFVSGQVLYVAGGPRG